MFIMVGNSMLCLCFLSQLPNAFLMLLWHSVSLHNQLVNTKSLERMVHDMNWGPDEAVPFMYVKSDMFGKREG